MRMHAGKTVAIKRYRATAFGSKSEVDMFCREVSILSKLSSPYVVNFVGACLDDPSVRTRLNKNASLLASTILASCSNLPSSPNMCPAAHCLPCCTSRNGIAQIRANSYPCSYVLRDRVLDAAQRTSCALDVARGMLYLHSLAQSVIHRDLNSHNILLHDQQQQLHAVVADFGESRFVRAIDDDNMTKQPGVNYSLI